MVTRFLFKDRNGRTPLPDEFKKALRPKYKNIKVGQELDEAEEENIALGMSWLESRSETGIDCLFWKKVHKKLFGDVWEWAGKIRITELANDDFDHPATIHENIKKMEGDLAFWLENKSFSDVREAIVRFHERFLTIHPFTNGNGRSCRILTEYICRINQLPVPTWGSNLRHDQKKHRNAYIEALLKARHEKNFQDLIDFMYS